MYWVLVALLVACLPVALVWERLIGHGYTEPAGSTSMENTVRPGDTLLAGNARDVRRGDVVAVALPPGLAGNTTGATFIRRVIGLPGDHVACCTAGHVTVDGKSLDETYLYPGDQPSDKTFAVTLGPNQVWVLGDHRSTAIDSRSWGPVPLRDVTARVEAVDANVGQPRFLATPQVFVTAGLAPPDHRTPWVVVPLFVAFAAVPLLIIVLIFGLIRTLLRRRHRHRTPRTPAPSL